MKVRVSFAARKRFRNTISFYRGYMTANEARKVVANVKAALVYLEDHPGWGAFEVRIDDSKKRYRRAIVGRIKIVYRVGRSIIHVTDIFDSRQDPRKVKG
ncbi:MAG: type II toxin-antitoxin system RelE/ParE family toxin [Flavobacteriales bacterium]|nr:type II toxin-antitoxin system RelE/ParE family toxin [Flavobacteriales bacterium]MBP9080413.1 type II toxin-antitoxin system RelE/ParE family toxin [Flavobacteriales bacterium]